MTRSRQDNLRTPKYFSNCYLFQDKESVANIVKLIDKCNGYIFSSIEGDINEFMKLASRDFDWDYYRYPSSSYVLQYYFILFMQFT